MTEREASSDTVPGEGTLIASNAFVSDLTERGAAEYSQVRPSYPREVVEVLLKEARAVRSKTCRVIPGGDLENTAITAVDVGAGTGKFTQLLVELGVNTVAVDPSVAMRTQLLRQPWAVQALQANETNGCEPDGGSPLLRVLDATAEQTGLRDQSADVVVWAQCFHWLDQATATTEAARILRQGGVAAIVGNQLDVEIPWVHRLSRIMRSGDVLRRYRTPNFGPHFGTPELVEIEWQDRLTTDELLALARTRSSYLKSDEPGKTKMQDNLRWYLHDHLGFEPGTKIDLPYRTFLWMAQQIPLESFD